MEATLPVAGLWPCKTFSLETLSEPPYKRWGGHETTRLERLPVDAQASDFHSEVITTETAAL